MMRVEDGTIGCIFPAASATVLASRTTCVTLSGSSLEIGCLSFAGKLSGLRSGLGVGLGTQRPFCMIVVAEAADDHNIREVDLWLLVTYAIIKMMNSISHSTSVSYMICLQKNARYTLDTSGFKE